MHILHTLQTQHTDLEQAEEAQIPAIVRSPTSRHEVHLTRMKRLVNLGYSAFLG